MSTMRRYEITDEQFALIAPLVSHKAAEPDAPRRRGRPRRDPRQVLNGIFWILCSGAPWRDLPERYGPWKSIYHWFRRWSDEGLFDEILATLHLELNDDGLIDLETWFIDATSIRATRAASGAKKTADLAKPWP